MSYMGCVMYLGRVGISCRSWRPANVIYGSGHHAMCVCLFATSCTRDGNESSQSGID